jgi:hypothetical protein
MCYALLLVIRVTRVFAAGHVRAGDHRCRDGSTVEEGTAGPLVQAGAQCGRPSRYEGAAWALLCPVVVLHSKAKTTNYKSLHPEEQWERVRPHLSCYAEVTEPGARARLSRWRGEFFKRLAPLREAGLARLELEWNDILKREVTSLGRVLGGSVTRLYAQEATWHARFKKPEVALRAGEWCLSVCMEHWSAHQ